MIQLPHPCTVLVTGTEVPSVDVCKTWFAGVYFAGAYSWSTSNIVTLNLIVTEIEKNRKVGMRTSYLVVLHGLYAHANTWKLVRRLAADTLTSVVFAQMLVNGCLPPELPAVRYAVDLAAQELVPVPDVAEQLVKLTESQARAFGVPPNSKQPLAEWRKLYRRLVVVAHPDKGGDALQFQALQTAMKEIAAQDKRSS